MKFRNTLILLGVVLALAIFVYIFEIRGPEDTDGKSKNLGESLSLEIGNINKIELVYDDPNYDKIVCSVNSDRQWRIEQPLKASADQKAINRLIIDAISKNIHTSFKDTADLSEYGLEIPRVVATFHLKDGTSRTLMLGNTVPTGNRVYVKEKNSPEIFLVPANIVDNLTKFVSDLRNRRVIIIDKTSVQRMRMEYANGTNIGFEKKGTEWHLVEPIAAKADANAVEKIISELNNLRVDRFVAENPGDLSVYGLTQPQLRFVASSGDGEDKILLVGDKKDGSMYAKTASGEAVFLIKSGMIDSLMKQPPDLRDRTVMDFDVNDVEKLELEHLEHSVVVEKKSGVWELTVPTLAKADEAKIDEILKRLSGLEAGEFVSDKSQDMAMYGLASPQVKVVISLKRSGTKTLLVGKKAGKSVYVKTASAESVYLVDAGIVGDLTRGWLGFRDRQMMDFRRDDVKRIDLRRKDETITFIKQERDWRIIEPMREKAKNYQVIDMMRKLDSLKAEKFVTEKTERLLEYGLDQPVVEVTVTLEDDSTKTLLVGDKVPDSDSYYAKIADADIIFIIKKDVVDELEKDLSTIRE